MSVRRKIAVFIPLVFALPLLAVLSASPAAARYCNQVGCPSAVVRISAPGGSIPGGGGGGGGGGGTPSDFHWFTAGYTGFCNVAGESVVTTFEENATLPSFDPTYSGGQTQYTSILVYNEGGGVVPGSSVVKRCGDAAPPPPPPSPSVIIADAENALELAVGPVVKDPDLRGLTGIDTNMTVNPTTPPLPVPASTVFYQVTATAALKSIVWDMGDGTILSGGSIHHTYGTKGNRTVTLTVTWTVTIQVTGLVNSTTVSDVPITLSFPYPVAEARGVLSSS